MALSCNYYCAQDEPPVVNVSKLQDQMALQKERKVKEQDKKTKEKLKHANSTLSLMEDSSIKMERVSFKLSDRSLLDDDDDDDDESKSTELDAISYSDFSSMSDPTTPLFKSAKCAQVQAIGKQIKKSKLQVTWPFQQGEGLESNIHFVTLTWSKYSGRILIHMDGEKILSTKVTFSGPYFTHKWTTEDGLEMQISAVRRITSILSLKKHDMIVNGKSFESFPECKIR
jgi:hypothetical protein